MSELTLFEMAAEGELFDCRPLEVEAPKGASEASEAERCHACGRSVPRWTKACRSCRLKSCEAQELTTPT